MGYYAGEGVWGRMLKWLDKKRNMIEGQEVKLSHGSQETDLSHHKARKWIREGLDLQWYRISRISLMTEGCFWNRNEEVEC